MATASVSGLDLRRRVEPRRLVLVTGGVAGIVATAVTALGAANSPILVDRSGDAIWRSLFVAAYVAVGECTWRRRPESRLGPIVASLGFLYSVTSLNASGAPSAIPAAVTELAGEQDEGAA